MVLCNNRIIIFNDRSKCFSSNCPKTAEDNQAPNILPSPTSHLQVQALQPYRSRSSHSISGGKSTSKRAESPSQKCYRNANVSAVGRTPTRHIQTSQRQRPSFLVSCGSSSSSSYLNSPTPIRKPYLNDPNQEQSLNGRTKNPTFNRSSARHTSTQNSSFSSLSITSGSNSSSTSYLPSPRPTRSRSSPRWVQEVRRAESPAAKSYNSSSTASSRHGWLYRQQYNCTADTTRGKGDRYNNNIVVRLVI